MYFKVTGFTLWWSIIAVGSVCTLYTCLVCKFNYKMYLDKILIKIKYLLHNSVCQNKHIKFFTIKRESTDKRKTNRKTEKNRGKKR